MAGLVDPKQEANEPVNVSRRNVIKAGAATTAFGAIGGGAIFRRIASAQEATAVDEETAATAISCLLTPELTEGLLDLLLGLLALAVVVVDDGPGEITVDDHRGHRDQFEAFVVDPFELLGDDLLHQRVQPGGPGIVTRRCALLHLSFSWRLPARRGKATADADKANDRCVTPAPPRSGGR